MERLTSIPFDYLALSFTEKEEDIRNVRRFFFPRTIFVIAKIETKKGVRNIDKIIGEANGVMVARGDLGDHVPLEKLPRFQKMIIKNCLTCKLSPDGPMVQREIAKRCFAGEARIGKLGFF